MKSNYLILSLIYIIFSLVGLFGIFFCQESGKCQIREKHNGNYDSQKTPVECFKNINYQSK